MKNILALTSYPYLISNIPSAPSPAQQMHSDNGDVAGLAVFQDPYAFIGVKRMNRLNYVVMVNYGATIDSALIDTSTIYLRAYAYYGTSRATFAYSLNDKSFTNLGNCLSMRFNLSVFTGDKFCLSNYGTIAAGGYVDFDWFRTYAGIPTMATPNEGLLLRNVPDDFFMRQDYQNQSQVEGN